MLLNTLTYVLERVPDPEPASAPWPVLAPQPEALRATSRVHLPVSFGGSWRVIEAAPVTPLLDGVHRDDEIILLALLMDDR